MRISCNLQEVLLPEVRRWASPWCIDLWFLCQGEPTIQVPLATTTVGKETQTTRDRQRHYTIQYGAGGEYIALRFCETRRFCCRIPFNLFKLTWFASRYRLPELSLPRTWGDNDHGCSKLRCTSIASSRADQPCSRVIKTSQPFRYGRLASGDILVAGYACWMLLGWMHPTSLHTLRGQ